MQHEFIRYNKDAIGRPEIFAGGGDKGKPKEYKDEQIDEEKIYEEDQNDEYNDQDDNRNKNQENQNQTNQTQDKEDDEEIDPLDAFMNGIDEEVRKEENNKNGKPVEVMETEEYDYDKLIQGEKEEIKNDSSGITYDENGNPIRILSSEANVLTSSQRKASYPPIHKNLYAGESSEVDTFIENWMKAHSIEIHNLSTSKESTENLNTPLPCLSFEDMKLPSSLLRLLNQQDYLEPTAIQACSLPLILSGRNIIGSSATGSGKTCCYLLPLLLSITQQSWFHTNQQGPLALILVPTRELAEQIASVAKPFFSLYHINSLCVTGGTSEWSQKKALYKQTYDVIIGTPGRFIELVNQNYCSLDNCCYLVLDEADRMVSMGFEQQIRSLLNSIREDCQMVLFSATFPPRIVRLALEFMQSPVRVAVGKSGVANKNIQQDIVVVKSIKQKIDWLKQSISEMEMRGKVLIFVSTRQAAEELTTQLQQVTTASIGCIHGDKLQYERSESMNAFKKGLIHILIATDVAARGLDVPDIQTVVNFDVPNNMDIYIHRIGRTCRASEENSSVHGYAVTLFTSENKQFASQLCHYLETNQLQIPSSLASLANGWTERINKKGTSGLGFNDDKMVTTADAFASYYKKEPMKQTSQQQIVNETPFYQTSYNEQENVFTTSTRSFEHSIQHTASTAVNGFVASMKKTENVLPVSAYGGPDDEWDSSKMAMESALAAIAARRKEEKMKKEEESRYSREKSYHKQSRSHSNHRHSRSRSRSRSHHQHSRSRYSHSRDRSSHRSHHESHHRNHHHSSRSRY